MNQAPAMFPGWGFPEISGTIFGVPIKRITVVGVYIGVHLFWETAGRLLRVGALGSSFGCWRL